MGQKIDTRSIGLDVGLSFIRWLTGAENLHYGLWDGLEVTASNLRAAQDAYTEKLFGLLPEGPLRILDIGGGAGETAKKLVALGHEVEIVVPSAYLASRCRAQAPQAVVHEMMFEDLQATERFDLCLFSESFQYIPLSEGLPKCLTLLRPGGHVILADCFRTPDYRGQPSSTVGGGHFVETFRAALADLPFQTEFEEDITRSVAASVDLEQGLYNVFGLAAMRIDDEMALKRPKSRWVLHRIIAAALSKRRRQRLAQRLFEQSRNADVFCRYNIYLMMKLRAPE
ncbi:MAG: class I SAM-dependent methyltransferase [Alphaproteobacteria bacterium]|nr:class I SAM-dependent methyltransferase [Alphaproteobacteria bacterium]NNF24470.1 methyltransferase domain-containing protein [Paracoccaceae bacterium]